MLRPHPRRRARRGLPGIRPVRQVDQTDCGPAALATVLAYWGREEPLYRLRELAGTTYSGTSLLGLSRAARALGMEAAAYEADLDGLRQLRLPLVLHWEHNHYVVLWSLGNGKVRVWDPGAGFRRLSTEALRASWTGRVLALTPSPAFARGRFVGRRGIPGLLDHLVHFRGATAALLEVGLGTLVLSLLGLGAPLFSQILFDRVLTFRDTDLLPYMLMALLVLSVSQTLFGALRTSLSSHLAMRLDYRLHVGYLHHLLHLPLRIHETRLIGDLVARFRDLSQVRGVLARMVVQVPTTALSLVLSLALVFTYNTALGLVALLNLPLQIAYLLLVTPRLRDNTLRSLRKGGEVQSYLLSSLEGLGTLKALRSEGWALARGRDQVGGLFDIGWQGARLSTWSSAVFGFLGNLGSLFLLWYGARQVIALQLTVGQLVATYGLIQNMLGALGTLTGSLNELQTGSAASDRLAEILELPPEAPPAPASPAATRLPPLTRSIRLEGVRFAYVPERPVLQGVDLELAQGTYTALLGGNGSGKSTLGRLLSRLVMPTGGRILWDGVDLQEAPLDEVRQRVVYMGADVPLFYATLRDNLTLGHEVGDERILELLETLKLTEVVRRLPEGLDTVVGGESPYHFSSGERQLLGLARVLLVSTRAAELFVLDEPTASLDLEREQRVVSLFTQLKGHRTLLVITHRPALVAPADQVLELSGGVVRARALDREVAPV